MFPLFLVNKSMGIYDCKSCNHQCQKEETKKSIPFLFIFLIVISLTILVANISENPPVVIAIIIAAGTLAYTAFYQKETARFSKLTFEMARKENAIKIISEYHNMGDKSSKFSSIAGKIKSGEIDCSAVSSLAEEDRTALTSMLNFYEKIGFATETDWACENILKNFFNSMIKRDWLSTKDFISELRNKRESNKIFEKFEWLANRWEK